MYTYVSRYNTYVPNKTISLPEEVLPIIESLDQPFSNWVREQLLLERDRRSGGDSRWDEVEALAQELAGRVEWASVEELRAGGDLVR